MSIQDLTVEDKIRRIELIQRSLGIRHKLKVHESMKSPDTHEEMAMLLLGKWELEDELRAIEEILGEIRLKNVAGKRAQIQREGVHHKAANDAADEVEAQAQESLPQKKKSKK